MPWFNSSSISDANSPDIYIRNILTIDTDLANIMCMYTTYTEYITPEQASIDVLFSSITTSNIIKT